MHKHSACLFCTSKSVQETTHFYLNTLWHCNWHETGLFVDVFWCFVHLTSNQQLPKTVAVAKFRLSKTTLRNLSWFTCFTICRQGHSRRVTKHGHYTIIAYLSSISAQPSTQHRGSEGSLKFTTRMCRLTSFARFMTSSPIERHINIVFTNIRATQGHVWGPFLYTQYNFPFRSKV